MQEVDIHDCINQAMETFSVNIESNNGQIHTNLKASNPVVKGDKEHLQNILNNLIDNAIKYSPGEINITLETTNEDGLIVLKIKDKGKGIAPEYLKHIFEKFYRVPTGNLHDVKGYGIGLNYVKLMVEKHRGSITVKSTEGTGTTFTVKFPIK